MVYPTAFVNSKVLHQNTFQPDGTVIAQGDVNVQGDVVLGNASTDTITFTAKAASTLNMDNNNISNVGNLTVNGNTTLGNATTDTVGFYGGGGSTRQEAITNLSVDNLSGTTNDTDQAGNINNGFNAVETRLNAVLTVLRNLNLIAS